MSGTPRPTIHTGQRTASGFESEAVLNDARETFLYSDPRWTDDIDGVLSDLTPFHTVATRRAGEVAVLPGFIVQDIPWRSDLNPGYFLTEGEGASCCGGSVSPSPVSADAMYPALFLGSPVGFCTEPFFTFWDDRLLGDMIAKTVAAASAAGIRCLVAPHIPQRLVGMNLDAEIESVGGSSAFFGREFYFPILGASFDAHLARLPRAQRLRLRGDLRGVPDDVKLDILEGTAFAALIPEASSLIAETYQRNGTNMPEQVLVRLLAAACSRFSTHGICAKQKSTGRLLAVHILIHHGSRLYGKWFGQASNWSREALYFPLLAAVPIQMAIDMKATTVESGAGAEQAKAMRGAASRVCRTAMLSFDPAVNALIASFLRAAGEARQKTAGQTSLQSMPLRLTDNPMADCCGGSPAQLKPAACCASTQDPDACCA